MKKAILLLLFIPLVFSCSGSEDSPITLTIENKDAVAERVFEVKLVGYEFLNLNIDAGSSKTFTLATGINGGISNVNVDIRVLCSNTVTYKKSISVNFTEGQNTTIRMTDKDPNDTTPMNCGDSIWSIIP
jgi:hypothetical protein